MFRRSLWFTAGAAAGVWATTKVNRKLRQLTPESLAAQAANKAVEAGHRLRDFALDVRDGMAQREAELDEALGLARPPGELPAPRRRAALPAARPLDITQHSKDPGPRDRLAGPANRNEDH